MNKHVEKTVYFCGSPTRANQALRLFLEKRFTVEVLENPKLPAPNREGDAPFLYLYDFQFPAVSHILDFLQFSEGAPNPGWLLVFNFVPGKLPQFSDLVRKGLRGVFLPDDPPELLAREISAVFKAELWPSRETPARLPGSAPTVTSEAEIEPMSSESADVLTSREREVLLKLAQGYTNRQISEQLFISTGTVKNHITRVFEKLGVSNRLQAALWLAQSR